jgi:hypothetical protein
MEGCDGRQEHRDSARSPGRVSGPEAAPSVPYYMIPAAAAPSKLPWPHRLVRPQRLADDVVALSDSMRGWHIRYNFDGLAETTLAVKSAQTPGSQRIGLSPHLFLIKNFY